jgi:hypothetical protein
MIKELNSFEYRKAIFIDFEGEGRSKAGEIKKPHMVGEFLPNQKGKGGKYHATFFRENWAPVKNGTFRESSIIEFSAYFENLADRLESEDCFLVFWSAHEETVMKKFLSSSLISTFENRFHNLHPVARRYANRRRAFGHDKHARGRSLEEFFEALYRKRKPMPPITLGPAEACRRLDIACAKHKKWKLFSSVQKKYAQDLLAYNRGDCQSTWLIAKKIGNFFAD